MLHEIFRLGGGKLFIEGDDEEMAHAEVADQSDLVLGRGKEMRRVLRTQYFYWVRIEGHDNRRSVFCLGVPRGSGNDRLMSAMDAVENADGEEERAGEVR